MKGLLRQSPKLAILSHVLPPSPSGQAVVLYRLLRDWPADRYCLLSTKDYRASASQAVNEDATQPLPANYHHLPSEWALRFLDSPMEGLVKTGLAKSRRLIGQVPGLPRSPVNAPAPRVGSPGTSDASTARRPWTQRCRDLIQSCEDRLNLGSCLRQRARRIERIVRQEGCEAILACSGDLLDLPAAALAARRLQVPFYIYLFDDYVYQWTQPHQRAFAQRLAEVFVPQAAGVVVPNEFLARSWESRFPGGTTLIRNVVELPDEPISCQSDAENNAGAWRMVYTGSIYTAHVDAFRNLLAALRNDPAFDCDLHIYSPSSSVVLGPPDCSGRVHWHAPVSAREANTKQREADVLFLPLAFASPYPELVNTSAPGKMGELLASGRPILVHAPAESYVSWYFRTHACGLVVDRPEPRLLAKALQQLRSDASLRARLVASARTRAHLDFDIARARACLQNLLQREKGAHGICADDSRARSA